MSFFPECCKLRAKHVVCFLSSFYVLLMMAEGENEDGLRDKKEQPEVESKRLQVGRRRRDIWGSWGQASTTEDNQNGPVRLGTG